MTSEGLKAKRVQRRIQLYKLYGPEMGEVYAKEMDKNDPVLGGEKELAGFDEPSEKPKRKRKSKGAK